MGGFIMKKRAFTLSEILVALAVIGVVAAITSPMITGLMPDKQKIKVLKMYKVINDINNELLDDTTLYHSGSDNTDINCVGLGCDSIDGLNSYEGIETDKYGALLVSKLYASDIKTNQSDGLITFSTSDGTTWMIDNVDNSSNAFRKITVDVDQSTKGKDCIYSNDCQKPDRYSFEVDSIGHLRGADPLTKAYLKNSMKLNDKKNDYSNAAKILKSTTSTTENKE
jgi:prepilin-type N-terminal cleavage/methylation domain-containing protein